MKRKREIVEEIAREQAVPLHTAADWFDRFLHDLMLELRKPSQSPPGVPREPTPEDCAKASGDCAKGRQKR